MRISFIISSAIRSNCVDQMGPRGGRAQRSIAVSASKEKLAPLNLSASSVDHSFSYRKVIAAYFFLLSCLTAPTRGDLNCLNVALLVGV